MKLLRVKVATCGNGHSLRGRVELKVNLTTLCVSSGHNRMLGIYVQLTLEQWLSTLTNVIFSLCVVGIQAKNVKHTYYDLFELRTFLFHVASILCSGSQDLTLFPWILDLRVLYRLHRPSECAPRIP
jgi:hypothetical protein